jgi:hypothetical protein
MMNEPNEEDNIIESLLESEAMKPMNEEDHHLK